MYAGSHYGQMFNHSIDAYPYAPSFGMGFATAGATPAIAATGPAAPFVAIAVAVAPMLAKLFVSMTRGCGQSCVMTSQAANEIEALLQENLRLYLASERLPEQQRAALYNFDEVWNQLVSYCGQPEFQSTKAGKNCIADRERDACKWKGDDGQCWNWFVGYRDPIANDTQVRARGEASNESRAGEDSKRSDDQSLSGLDGGNMGGLIAAAALLALVFTL